MAPAALIVANRLPWPIDDGWKMRTWHSVKAFAQAMPTTLVVGDGNLLGDLKEARASLGGEVEIVEVPLGRRNTFARLTAGALTNRPIQYLNQQTREAHRIVAELAAKRRFSVGLAVYTYMWPYLAHLDAEALRVVDTHNVDSVNLDRYVHTLRFGPRRWYTQRTTANLRALEREVFTAADQVWVCSAEEARDVAKIRPDAGTHVVPNGVDTVRFHPRPETVVQHRLLFFGRLDYHPNTDAVLVLLREIFPLIRSAQPEVELKIVGPNAPPALMEAIAATPGVELVGRVDDVPATIATAAIVVVPLRAGGGTRLKILEAMAVGRPVVSTTIGAEGLQMTDGAEIEIADAPADFAARVVALLNAPGNAHALGARGRAAVVARHDWATIRGAMVRLAVGTRAG